MSGTYPDDDIYEDTEDEDWYMIGGFILLFGVVVIIWL